MEESKQQELIEHWANDNSFINWVLNNNSADVEKWEQYFKKHPELLEPTQIAKSIILGLPINIKTIPEEQINQSWEKVVAESERVINKRQQEVKKARRVQFIGWSVAASIVFIIGLAGWFFYTINQETAIHIATKAGEQKEIKLPDGSEVFLNANSSMSYFKRDSRSISLRGEAFFKIKKTEDNQKFEVRTNKLTVQVLGTEFNVNTNFHQTSVYLKEGKVILDINEKDESIKMLPGNLVIYKDDNTIEKVTKLEDEDMELSWIRGSLVFKNANLKDVLNEVEAIYSIQFDLEKINTSDIKVTTGLPVNDLELALELLKNTLSLEFKQLNEQQFSVKRLE